MIRNFILILFFINVMGSKTEEKNKKIEANKNINLEVDIATLIFQYLPLEMSLTGRQVCQGWNTNITKYLNHLLEFLLDQFQPEIFSLYPIDPSVDVPCLSTKKSSITWNQHLANTATVDYYLEAIASYEKYLATETHEFARNFKTVLGNILDRLGPRKNDIEVTQYPLVSTQPILTYNRTWKYITNFGGFKLNERGNTLLIERGNTLLYLPMVVKTTHTEENEEKEIWWCIFGSHMDFGIDGDYSLTVRKNYQDIDIKGIAVLKYYSATKTFQNNYIFRDGKRIRINKVKPILSIFDY